MFATQSTRPTFGLLAERPLRLTLTLGLSLALLGCSSSTSQNPRTPQETSGKPTPNARTETNPTQQPQPLQVAPRTNEEGRIEEVVVTGSKLLRDQGAQQRPRIEQEVSSDYALATQAVRAAPAPTLQGRWVLPYRPDQGDTEQYPEFDSNSVVAVRERPVSTFAIDVDTASYSNMRRLLGEGRLPRVDAVRVEELVNYFSYDYQGPAANSEHPFAVHTEMGPSPWHPNRHLLHIGVQGETIDRAALPASNLVFLIDVSGSMQSNDKLPLLRNAMKLLTRQLKAEDKVAIVVYAGAAGVVLEPTLGSQKAQIAQAIDRLEAGGSTHGSAGIKLAYQLAEQHFVEGGVNRVILATDGDFNVGTVDQRALKELITQKRKTGVALTVLGFGGGNYNDAIMQELAQSGDGNAAYIDTLNEARKVLVDELAATLTTIAKDVKIQVEFNPAVVSEYRLVGFETRALRREDFNNDKVDAGEIGAGHSVTALYEVSLVGSNSERLEPLRYQQGEVQSASQTSDLSQEVAHLRLRYKDPQADKSQLVTQVIQRRDLRADLASTSERFRFSAAVAGFGQLLRGGEHLAELSFNDVLSLGQNARGSDAYGYRGEFINLVRTAAALSGELSQELDDSVSVQLGYRDH